MTAYADFLGTKRMTAPATGRVVNDCEINQNLFPFQRDLVRWAVRKGRAAIFADTGLGKTFMQVEWARLTGQPTLILAPLSVARQTVREAAKLGIEVVYSRGDVVAPITITNYEMLGSFDVSQFGAVVLDESSILKAMDGKTRQRLTEAFKATPYRLCCTATPAPNDITEIANHAEFLGVMSRAEMLSAFFVHDSDSSARGGWRLKGHAEESFYRWLASWGMSVRKPSDLGYSDEGYDLPPLNIEPRWVEVAYRPEGKLFHMGLHGITDRSKVRKETASQRVAECVKIIQECWNRNASIDANTIEIGTPEIASKSGPNKRPVANNYPTKNESYGGNNGTSTISLTESGSSPTLRDITNAIPPLSVQAESDEPTGLLLPSMSDCTQPNVAAVPSAKLPLPQSAMGSTSTMTTLQEQSAGCSVKIATAESGNSKTNLSDSARPYATSKEPWLVWVGLDVEQTAMAAALGDDCVSVYGSLTPDEKQARIDRWLNGEVAVLLSKARITGYGLNLQRASKMAFVGLSDSWESYYQCIRRAWRFGQTKPVDAYIVLSDAEEDIYHNVMRKEEESNMMRAKLIEHAKEYEQEEIAGIGHNYIYATDDRAGDRWRLMLGDSCERLAEVEPESIDLSVFSPPFLSLFTYSPTERDVGNCHGEDEFYQHFGVIIHELFRVTKPGRLAAVHVQQVTSTLVSDGVIGLKDFRGGVIRAFQERGWDYHGEVTIDKDPQAQAIRTHSKGLLFVQLHKDSTWSRPALADFIIIFRKPGENAVPVVPDMTNDEWITWAHPVWYGIRESETLNAAEGRDDKDERHIAALQLGTIERCVRLWSNPGETVLSPFAGIGSEGYVAVKHGRKFVGIELKQSYFSAACRNLSRAEETVTRRLL